MKTSNKLIALGILLCSISAFSFMAFVKSSMIDKVDVEKNDIIVELEGKLSDEDKEYVERSLGVLSANTLDLDGNHRYMLDPTTNEVTVTGPAHIVKSFSELADDDIFEAPIYKEVAFKKEVGNSSQVYDRISDTLFYNIGISETQSLVVLIGNESKVSANTPLQMDELKLFMQGNAHMDAELNCETISVKSDDNGHLRLIGTAKSAEFLLQGNSNIECYGLSIVDAEVMLSDNSRLEAGIRRNISGLVLDNAYYGNTEPINVNNLIVKNNARVDNR